MRPYSEYKESDVEWIGEIPSHWEAKKLRYFCSIKSGNGFSNDLQGKTGLEVPFFKVADTNTPENKVEMLRAENTVSSQEVLDFKFTVHAPYSIVFPKIGAALLLNKRNILIKESCIDNNMMSLSSNQSNHKFLYYATLNVDFKRHYRAGGPVPSINESEVGNIPIAYPSILEQKQIASFLDSKTQQIDELIRIKERKIELLQEQRTALINQAVTKGLDPNVEMKLSGVEWIGEIPKHWSLSKGKYLFQIKNGTSPEHISFSDSGTLNYVRVDDLNTGEDKLLLKDSSSLFESTGLSVYPPGLILFPKRGAAIATNKVRISAIPCMFDTNLMGLVVDEEKANREFIAHVLLTRGLFDIADVSTIPQINNKHIYPLTFPLPPLKEQERIIDYLDQKTQQIDELVSEEQQKIELLTEYRQSLISEVVTGKIDVGSET